MNPSKDVKYYKSGKSSDSSIIEKDYVIVEKESCQSNIIKNKLPKSFKKCNKDDKSFKFFV